MNTTFIYMLCVCVCAHANLCTCMRMCIRDQLSGFSSLLPSDGAQASQSGYQVWQQAPLLTELSYGPKVQVLGTHRTHCKTNTTGTSIPLPGGNNLHATLYLEALSLHPVFFARHINPGEPMTESLVTFPHGGDKSDETCKNEQGMPTSPN